MNPYDELGVPTDADEAAIRKAYREQAKTAHPDRDGGSDEAFHRKSKALAVLLNPKARADYDKTGHVGDPEPDNAEAKATSCLCGAVMRSIAESGASVLSVDLLAVARNKLGATLLEAEKQLANIEKDIGIYAKLAERVSRKSNGRANLLKRTFDTNREGAEAARRQVLEIIETHKAAIALAHDYELIFDAPPSPFGDRHGSGFQRIPLGSFFADRTF